MKTVVEKKLSFLSVKGHRELYSRPRIFLLTRCNGIQIPDGYFDGGDVFDVVFAGWNLTKRPSALAPRETS